jgi:hypothetical protein
VEMAFGEMDFAIGLWRNEELGFQRERVVLKKGGRVCVCFVVSVVAGI